MISWKMLRVSEGKISYNQFELPEFIDRKAQGSVVRLMFAKGDMVREAKRLSRSTSEADFTI